MRRPDWRPGLRRPATICIVPPVSRSRRPRRRSTRRPRPWPAGVRTTSRAQHIVEACGATAHISTGHVDHLHTLDRSEQRAGLLPEVLHAERVDTRRGARTRSNLGSARRMLREPLVVEKLRHIADLRRERVRLVGGDQIAELLQVRAAARRVGHDDVDAGEGAQVAFGELARGVEPTVVGRQGPAAHLRSGDHHAPPVPRQHADRREVHAGETVERARSRSVARRSRAPRRRAASRGGGGGTAPNASGWSTGCVPGARGARAVAPPRRATAASSAGARRRARATGGASSAGDLSGSTWTRARSTIRPNGTCEGQTSSQARHARRSRISEARERLVGTERPSATERIAVIRPRGEADSSPVARYVGRCGKHSPHATQAARSASAGASSGNRHLGPRSGVGPTNRARWASRRRAGRRHPPGRSRCARQPMLAPAPRTHRTPVRSALTRCTASTVKALERRL